MTWALIFMNVLTRDSGAVVDKSRVKPGWMRKANEYRPIPLNVDLHLPGNGCWTWQCEPESIGEKKTKYKSKLKVTGQKGVFQLNFNTFLSLIDTLSSLCPHIYSGTIISKDYPCYYCLQYRICGLCLKSKLVSIQLTWMERLFKGSPYFFPPLAYRLTARYITNRCVLI